MRYTLSDILEGGVIQGWRQLTEVADLSKIHVNSTTIQEMPTGEAATQGEVILTTAHECWEHPEMFVDMVQGMVRSRAAAVLFSFPHEGIILPEAAVRLAQEGGLPLFVIPWTYRLSEIQMAVFKGIREKELLEYHRLQNILYNLFFQSRPLADAVEAVSRGLRMPAAVLDQEGELVQRSRTADGQPKAGSAPLRVEVGARPAAVYGTLVLYPTQGQEPDPQALAQYVAFPLSLWFHKRSTENMANVRIRNEFVWSLANSRDTPWEELVYQASYLGFDLERPYTCIAMKVQLPETLDGVEKYSAQTAQNNFDITDLLLREAGRQGLRIMSGNLGLSYILYIENRPEKAAQGIVSFLDGADERLRRRFPQWDFFWGVGETDLERTDYPEAYDHAAQALKYCLNAKDGARRFTYQNTQKALIVATLSQSQEIRERAQRLLGRLLDYDAASEIHLMDTLITYLSSSYNISQTARQLHIHRQSLLYRLEKIEQLTGMSLDNHENLFILETFSRIYRSY